MRVGLCISNRQKINTGKVRTGLCNRNRFKVNGSTPANESFRLLEDGFYRLLEDGGFRLLE